MEPQVDSSFEHLTIHTSFSGTVSSALLHQYLEFMLEFLTKLEEAVEKNTNFAAGDKVNIYQVRPVRVFTLVTRASKN